MPVGLRIVTRRKFLGTLVATSGAALVFPLLQGCATNSAQPAAPAGTAAPATGGSATPAAAGKPSATQARIATNAEPPTLDPHWTTASIVYTVGWHMFETLMAPDKEYRPQPQLANKMEATADGLTWNIELRKGVKFHNGKEMTSADVIASLSRWGKLASPGRTAFAAVDGLDAVGDYGVKLRMKRPFGSFPAALSNWSQEAAIMPKEIAEKAGSDNKVTEFVGTGPYKFVEWQPDRQIKLTRYDGYQARSEAPSALSGKREAIIKDLLFLPATDDAARVTGLKAGDYDLAMFVPPDNYADLKNNTSINMSITKPFQWYSLVMNTELAPLNNVKMRQAIQACLDAEQVMRAAGGPQDFWRLDNALMPFGIWWSDAGKENYSQKNVAKAKQLAAEAGYKGEPLVYMTSRAYDFIYKTAVTASQQLKDAGFNIDLQVIDWATLTSRRAKPEGWNLFTTGIGMPPDPSLHQFMSCAARWPGFWCNKDVDALMGDFQKSTDFEARKKIWDKVQTLFWQDAGIIKFGDGFVLQAYTKKLKGFANFVDVFLWNCTLEQ
ncbi:MAG: ABC transporter substrate-binding protein [Chloroflexota bacterium]